MNFLLGNEKEFLIKLFLCLIIGVAIGMEREYRGKSAGISTHSFVIGGAMLFSYLSLVFDAASPARIAAQVVTGVGFPLPSVWLLVLAGISLLSSPQCMRSLFRLFLNLNDVRHPHL